MVFPIQQIRNHKPFNPGIFLGACASLFSNILTFLPPNYSLTLSTSLFVSAISASWLVCLLISCFVETNWFFKILGKIISHQGWNPPVVIHALWIKFTAYKVWYDPAPTYLSPWFPAPFSLPVSLYCPSSRANLRTNLFLGPILRMFIFIWLASHLSGLEPNVSFPEIPFLKMSTLPVTVPLECFFHCACYYLELFFSSLSLPLYHVPHRKYAPA